MNTAIQKTFLNQQIGIVCGISQVYQPDATDNTYLLQEMGYKHVSE